MATRHGSCSSERMARARTTVSLLATLMALLAVACSGAARDESTGSTDDDVTVAAPPAFADYGAAIRRPDGRLDTGAMVARLQALRVTTYAFLIWGWRYQATPFYDTDFADLAAFLPAAARAGIKVWAYLPSPIELAMHAPPPCKGDYACWGTRLGKLAAEHGNLEAIVLDDMFSKPNAAKMTPAVVSEMRSNARANAPSLQVLPIAYFTNAMHGLLARDYTRAIDGVVFVNLNRSIDDTNLYLNDQLEQIDTVVKGTTTALSLHVAASANAKTGDRAALIQTVKVGAGPHTISFGEGDDLFAKGDQPAVAGANGARMVQLLVNGNKAWERDLNMPPAPGETPGFQRHTIDVSHLVTPGRQASIVVRAVATREYAGVPGIDVELFGVSAQGLSLADGDWTDATSGGEGWSAAAARRAYKNKRNVMMIYANTLANGWTPDAAYISAGLNFAHNRMSTGLLDGVITYQLDKTDLSGGSRFATVSALYGAWH